MAQFTYFPIKLLASLALFHMTNSYPQLFNMYHQQPMYQMQMDGMQSPIVPINSMYASSPDQLISRTPYNPYGNSVSSYGGSYSHQQQKPFFNHPFQQQQLQLQQQQALRMQQLQQQQRSYGQFQPFGQSAIVGTPYDQFPTVHPSMAAVAQQSQQSYFPGGRQQILPSDIPLEVVVGRQMGNAHQMQSIQDIIGGGQSTETSQQPIPQNVDLQTPSNAVGYGASSFTNPSTPKQFPSVSSGSSESLPVFLKNAPQEIVDEFKRIIRQPNSSYETQVQQIDKLVERLDGHTQTLYKEFMTENDEREKTHRDRVHKTVATMSEKAQEQFSKISAVLRNPNEPDQNRWERVLQIYGKMDPELRDEFEQKFKGFATINDRPLK